MALSPEEAKEASALLFGPAPALQRGGGGDDQPAAWAVGAPEARAGELRSLRASAALLSGDLAMAHAHVSRVEAEGEEKAARLSARVSQLAAQLAQQAAAHAAERQAWGQAAAQREEGLRREVAELQQKWSSISQWVAKKEKMEAEVQALREALGAATLELADWEHKKTLRVSEALERAGAEHQAKMEEAQGSIEARVSARLDSTARLMRQENVRLQAELQFQGSKVWELLRENSEAQAVKSAALKARDAGLAGLRSLAAKTEVMERVLARCSRERDEALRSAQDATRRLCAAVPLLLPVCDTKQAAWLRQLLAETGPRAFGGGAPGAPLTVAPFRSAANLGRVADNVDAAGLLQRAVAELDKHLLEHGGVGVGAVEDSPGLSHSGSEVQLTQQVVHQVAQEARELRDSVTVATVAPAPPVTGQREGGRGGRGGGRFPPAPFLAHRRLV
jgi:hypothetical protein